MLRDQARARWWRSGRHGGGALAEPRGRGTAPLRLRLARRPLRRRHSTVRCSGDVAEVLSLQNSADSRPGAKQGGQSRTSSKKVSSFNPGFGGRVLRPTPRRPWLALTRCQRSISVGARLATGARLRRWVARRSGSCFPSSPSPVRPALARVRERLPVPAAKLSGFCVLRGPPDSDSGVRGSRFLQDFRGRRSRRGTLDRDAPRCMRHRAPLAAALARI